MKNVISRALATSAVGIVVMAAACSRGNSSPPASTTTTTGANWVTNEDAIQRLTNLRCDREVACNNIGEGQKYASRDSCIRELGYNTRADLKTSECPRGIDGREFDHCLNSVQNERCGNPLDTVTRLTTCRAGAYCMK